MTAERFKNMRWVIIGLCFLANAINFIDRANLAIAAPHIRAELALDPTTMGVIMSAFFWTYALCQMPAGWFIDKVGVRVSLAFAVAWWSIFTAVTGMVHTFGHMVGRDYCLVLVNRQLCRLLPKLLIIGFLIKNAALLAVFLIAVLELVLPYRCP